MSTKVTIDGDGQEFVVLEYGLSAADLADFMISRYRAVGGFRRHVLTNQILVTGVIILVAPPVAYWVDFHDFSLAVFIVFLVILRVVGILRAPAGQLGRVRKYALKLASKDPSALANRRLTITPDSIEEELQNHRESSAWEGVREIVESKQAIFICIGNWKAYVIPKRVFDASLTCAHFLDIVRKFHLRVQPPVDALPAEAVGGT